MKRRRDTRGQSLVETAIVLPLLLLLAAAGYWGFRRLSLEASAASAAQAHLLRAGRMQADISQRLAASVAPGGMGVAISARDTRRKYRVPPFSGLAGLTASCVEVSRQVDAIGGFLEVPPHTFRADREAAVDCWGSGSRSGRNIRRVVRATVAAGALR